jgi:inosine triphosphate pyrophosphatase
MDITQIVLVFCFYCILYVSAFPRPLSKGEKICFVSGNTNKAQEAIAVLDPDRFPWELEVVGDVDMEEIQATQLEVAIHKCRQAQRLCPNRPVIVEDTSLCLTALGGLPSVYIKDFWETLGNKGMISLLDGYEDRSAYVQCTLCFARDGDSPVKTFVGKAFGSITKEERGDKNFGWDSIFQPIHSDKTFAEMSMAEKNAVSHRAKAFKQLQTYLNSRMGS